MGTKITAISKQCLACGGCFKMIQYACLGRWYHSNALPLVFAVSGAFSNRDNLSRFYFFLSFQLVTICHQLKKI